MRLASTAVLALTTDDLATIAVVAAVAVLVIGILAALLIKAIVTKIVMIVVAVGLAFLVWSQRTQLVDCADKVKAAVEAGTPGTKTQCRFFGYDVDVSVPTP